MDFDATQRTIAEVIRTGDHWVPRYQRDYAWEEENVQDLWDDLKISSDDQYFIGNMVVHENGPASWDLVDGQQRLTTVLIALAAIRDKYQDSGEAGRANGLAEYIQQTNLSGETTFRLRARSGSNFLQKRILSNSGTRILAQPPTSDAEKAQMAAYEIFRNRIQSELEGSGVNSAIMLDAIRDRFLTATVIYVRAGDKKNAFRVFETLNDRGKSLRQVDLVKNQVISAIPSSGTGEEESLWEQSISAIESTSWSKVDAEDFLGYFWNSTSWQPDDEIVAVTRIRRSVDRALTGYPSPDDGARDFIRVFHQTAVIFKEFDRCLAAPNGKHWKEVVDNGRYRKDVFEEIDLALYGCLVPTSNLPLNVLFALLRSYAFNSEKIMSKSILLKFLQAIEVLQFRWSISKKPSTSTIRRAYRKAAFAVDGAKTPRDFEAAYSSFISDASRLVPTDAQFKDGLKSLTYFDQKPADIFRLRHVLETIERFWGNSRLPRNKEMTLEHIEPQGGRSISTPQNFWVGKLGNLTLIPGEVNSWLPAAFDLKSNELSKWVNSKDLVLHRQLNQSNWSNSVANERMEQLLDIATRVWPKFD